MKKIFLGCLVLALGVGVLMVLIACCILPDGGIGCDDSACVNAVSGCDDSACNGAVYYETSGGDYGGWGPGYQVAPFRDGGHRHAGGGGRASAPAYRSAPASRSMPSLPSRGGGGGRGGGGVRR